MDMFENLSEEEKNKEFGELLEYAKKSSIYLSLT